jgi:hypothetical protein
MAAFDFPPGFADEANNLAIDFDGVIHNADKGFHDGTCYGDPIPGSLDALKLLATKYRIVIFTAKAKSNRPLVNGKTGTELVSEWLEKNEVLRYVADITSEKPRAILYIDDNAYQFKNWEKTLEYTQGL